MSSEKNALISGTVNIFFPVIADIIHNWPACVYSLFSEALFEPTVASTRHFGVNLAFGCNVCRLSTRRRSKLETTRLIRACMRWLQSLMEIYLENNRIPSQIGKMCKMAAYHPFRVIFSLTELNVHLLFEAILPFLGF